VSSDVNQRTSLVTFEKFIKGNSSVRVYECWGEERVCMSVGGRSVCV
jgi:hypothetical protein